MPVIDEQKLYNFGVMMSSRYDQYKKDRKETEDQWLRNMRQFRGIYDPEIARLISDDQSHAYPKVTRTKVIGTLSRLMEMLFPQTEKNWGITSSPLPDLSKEDLQTVINLLTEEKGGSDALTDDDIEKAVKSFADAKAERMSVQMDDQLSEMEYITLARKVIYSAILYSVGVLKGPQVVKKKSRTWSLDPLTRQYKAVEIEKYAPMYEVLSVWDWYPDLSAKTLDGGDGSFTRHIMSRNQLSELKDRPDFMEDRIDAWLASHTGGNYKELNWERELRSKGDRNNVSDLSGRKYELWDWWGFVTGRELANVGVDIPVEDYTKEFEANVWGIDNFIIKATLNPYDKRIRPFHVFVYEEDDINLLGTGLPQIMRDSQLAICEASRMILDNGSVVCGPILELNQDLLLPGQSLDVHAFKVFLREGTGPDATAPAVRPIEVNSHIAELQAVVNLFMGFADNETALPPSALGDVSQGGSEALRTQGNLSMVMGAAALPIRDTVRNFDKFTTSFIGSLYYWNMQFGTDESSKGDFDVIARGSTSLIAKEVRSLNLDNFRTTLSEDEQMYIDTEKMLIERMKSRDLPMTILASPDVVKQRLDERAQRAQATAEQQARLLDTKIREGVAAAFKDVALAVKAQTGANVDTFNAIMEGVLNATAKAEGGGKGTTGTGSQ